MISEVLSPKNFIPMGFDLCHTVAAVWIFYGMTPATHVWIKHVQKMDECCRRSLAIFLQTPKVKHIHIKQSWADGGHSVVVVAVRQ